MPYFSDRLGKILFSSACLSLLTSRPEAAPRKNLSHSLPSSHISFISTLYQKDTVLYDRFVGLIHREKNGNLVITIPAGWAGRYSIRFYDADHYFLFAFYGIQDDRLIVEQSNFRRAGMFQYELYRDRTLVEKSSFLIKKD